MKYEWQFFYRNWKEELLALQSALVLSEGVNVVNVARDHVLDSFKRATSRKSFSPCQKFDICFVDNCGNSEGSIDSGGPTREFFRLLLSEIANSSIFLTLPDGCKQMELSTCGKKLECLKYCFIRMLFSRVTGLVISQVSVSSGLPS